MGRGCERRIEQVEYRWELEPTRWLSYSSSVGDRRHKILWLINKTPKYYIFTFLKVKFVCIYICISFETYRFQVYNEEKESEEWKGRNDTAYRTSVWAHRQFHDTKWPRLFFKIHLKTVQFPWLRTTTRAVRSNERGVRRWKDTTGTENLIKSLYEAE